MSNGKQELFQAIEPWPEPVNGAALLSRLVLEFERAICFTKEEAYAAALWIVHTYALDAARHSPILAWQSPVPRCGKTSALEVVGALAHRAVKTSNITPAALFRMIDKYHPTLIVDEADTFVPEDEALRGILNSGHARAAAATIRCHPKTLDPERFSTWGAKTIAGIGELPRTLQDRSIVIQLRRVGRTARAKPWLQGPPSESVRRRLVRWSADHMDELKRANPAIPDQLDDRAADNWRPLIAVADVAEGEWPDRARAAAIKLSRTREAPALGELLLMDIYDWFAERKRDRVASGELVSDLRQLEERPWLEYTRDRRPLSVNQLAHLLRPFGIRPGTVRFAVDSTAKGYRADQFEDSWRRYLGLESPVETDVTEDVTARGTGVPGITREKSAVNMTCDGVTATRRTAVSPTSWLDELVLESSVRTHDEAAPARAV